MFIEIEDDMGWTVGAADLKQNAGIIAAVVNFLPHRVPSLLMLMLAIMVADSIVDNRIVKQCETTALKCHHCEFHFFFATGTSQRSST